MNQREETNLFTVILAILGAAAIIAGIAYAIYRLISPDYLDDLLEEFDEEFQDEDYFAEAEEAE